MNESTVDEIVDRAQAKIDELHKAALANLNYYSSEELIAELKRRHVVLSVGQCPYCEREYDLPPEHLLLEIKTPHPVPKEVLD